MAGELKHKFYMTYHTIIPITNVQSYIIFNKTRQVFVFFMASFCILATRKKRSGNILLQIPCFSREKKLSPFWEKNWRNFFATFQLSFWFGRCLSNFYGLDSLLGQALSNTKKNAAHTLMPKVWYVIETDICMLVLSKLVSSKCLLFPCLKNRAKKGYILE